MKKFIVLQAHYSSGRKDAACSAWDLLSTPGLERSPREGNVNPLQYSCLGNPMGGGAQMIAVCGITRVEQDLVAKLPPTWIVIIDPRCCFRKRLQPTTDFLKNMCVAEVLCIYVCVCVRVCWGGEIDSGNKNNAGRYNIDYIARNVMWTTNSLELQRKKRLNFTDFNGTDLISEISGSASIFWPIFADMFSFLVLLT